MKLSKLTLLALTSALCALTANADPRLPNIFGDHMVLQQKHKNPVWGKANPGEAITVVIGRQNKSTTADSKGNWKVKLDPLAVGGPYKMVVKGDSTVTFDDVLVGEVWVCSGQSNMRYNVAASDDADVEILTARFPNLRIISVPNVGTQVPQDNFEGKWEAVTPKSIPSFSAAGYFFGRILHQGLDIPVGLINNAWGGSAAEAWVRKDVLSAEKRYAPLLEQWAETEKTYDHKKATAAYEAKRAEWQARVKKARVANKPLPRAPRAPRNPLAGQHRPANLYNGVLKPIIGYGIKGAIWYQGESNAGRAEQYGHLFPLMISHWRDEWQQGDFSFYWVQLADFRGEKTEPAESDWAELREAQTKSQRLPNTGQAVITDIGEGRDIHPRDKQNVGKRLARLALAKDYGIKVAHRSPEYKSMLIKGNRATIKFDHVNKGLYAFDTTEVRGFSIAGKDKKFHWAKASIVGKDTVIVSSDAVKEPVAVRYNWADNPIGNLTTKDPLPATSFRTDNWPGLTTGVVKR
ncbi:MAG: sialate O-acetylesterase [Limisphaerales bacterium]|jgi:sialate O-acetylesterase